MGYTDYYIKAPSKEAFDAVVPTEQRIVRYEGELENTKPVYENTEVGWEGVVFDRVGIIYRNTGILDDDQFPVLEPTEGYHVNIRVSEGYNLPEELSLYVIQAPVNPKRVWLGSN